MNKKPQGVREDEQEDLLEQIITQELDRLNASAQAQAGEETPGSEVPSAPGQEDSGETAPPADRKNRRSAVYLYLLVLFGAAFLMLLLAYFIQQRNSESAISDLKDSMNLSREELLAQIKDLEEDNAALNDAFTAAYSDLTQLQKRYEEKDEELTDLWDILYSMQEEVYCYHSFLQLEQYYQSGDLESCAAILLLQMQSQYPYHAPDGTDQRQEEIVRAVVGAGILEENFELHPEDYEYLLDAFYENLGVLTEPIP